MDKFWELEASYGVGSATRTPTWARRLLTRLARLFWSLASVNVVDGTSVGDRYAIWRESQ
jgi:hypothetical protein